MISETCCRPDQSEALNRRPAFHCPGEQRASPRAILVAVVLSLSSAAWADCKGNPRPARRIFRHSHRRDCRARAKQRDVILDRLLAICNGEAIAIKQRRDIGVLMIVKLVEEDLRREGSCAARRVLNHNDVLNVEQIIHFCDRHENGPGGRGLFIGIAVLLNRGPRLASAWQDGNFEPIPAGRRPTCEAATLPLHT
jgi:hypothetical protein